MRYIIGLSLAALASMASAQNSNTTCTRFGNQVNCNTTTRPPLYTPPPAPIILQNPANVGNGVMDSFNRGMQAAAEADRARSEAARARAEAEYYRSRTNDIPPAYTPPPAKEPQEFVATLDERKHIGELLKAGDCKGAVNASLDAGDIDLAKKVVDFCSSQPQP
jgi:hypothetical protein